VQAVVRLIFDQFDCQGTLHGVLRYLVHHGIRIPVRPHFGPNRGQLEWRRPNRETLQNLLHHPIYAGAYRHGHRALDPRRQQPGRPGTGRQWLEAVFVSGNNSQGGADGQGNTSGNGLGGGVYVDASATARMDMETLIAGNHASKDNNDVWGTITIVP
jgi:hypothetical protein